MGLLRSAYWIWWDAYEATTRLLKSIPFWLFEVTVAAAVAAVVGESCGAAWGLVASLGILATFIFVGWFVLLVGAALRLARYAYARDVVLSLMGEKAGAKIGFANALELACFNLEQWSREGRVRSLGRKSRTLRPFVAIPKLQWGAMKLDVGDLENVHGTRGRTRQGMAAPWYEYQDVMFRRGDVRNLPIGRS